MITRSLPNLLLTPGEGGGAATTVSARWKKTEKVIYKLTFKSQQEYHYHHQIHFISYQIICIIYLVMIST